MSTNDGGPAFPAPEDWKRDSGMTLRDYFAAHALTTSLGYEKEDIAIWEPVDFACHAYRVADAMLAERLKSEGPALSRNAILEEAKAAVWEVSIPYECTSSEAVRAIEALKDPE